MLRNLLENTERINLVTFDLLTRTKMQSSNAKTVATTISGMISFTLEGGEAKRLLKAVERATTLGVAKHFLSAKCVKQISLDDFCKLVDRLSRA